MPQYARQLRKKGRQQRFKPLERTPSLVAARPTGLAHDGGWWKKRQKSRVSFVS